MSKTSVLLSPFWESVDERWIGGTLLVLAALMLCSQALAVARIKSVRMYLVSVTFTVLAAVLVSSSADSLSPRELQHWIMLPQTLGTLAAMQIFWIGVTVFFSVKEEISEKPRRFLFWSKLLFIRLMTALPSPVFLLFLVWIQQNLLMESSGARPQVVGFQVGIAVTGALTVLAGLMILWLKRHQLIGLHLLVGCILLMTCVLLPCLTQKLTMEASTPSLNYPGIFAVSSLCGLFVLIGIFIPRKFFP